MPLTRSILFLSVFYILGILFANAWGLIGLITEPSAGLPDDFVAFVLFEIFAALLWPVQMLADFIAGNSVHKMCDIAIVLVFVTASYQITRAIRKRPRRHAPQRCA